VSVTQAALAVVGAIIGSSLLTIVAFALVLRYRRTKLRQAEVAASTTRSNIGYPALMGSSNAGSGVGYEPSAYETSYGMPPKTAMTMNSNGFPMDIKEPLPVLNRTNTVMSGANPRPRNNSGAGGMGGGPDNERITGVGYATSDYGPPPQTTRTAYANPEEKEFQLRDPPKSKLSLFPRKMDEPSPPPAGPLPRPPQGSGPRSPKSTSPQQRGSKAFPPSLDTWLRAGTVSPFGTLGGALPQKEEKRDTQWPMKQEK
jgi:hypothetical protein